MQATKYYQIGGFRPNIRWFENDWSDKKLVEVLAGPSSPLISSKDRSLELVLGIRETGTSHLLLADTQASIFEKVDRRRTHGFTTIGDYTSVSPIYFTSAHELEQKLKILRPKAKKKAEAWDNSQANKAYKDGSKGITRGEFEHGRILYCLLQNTINPAVYSIPNHSWTPSLRIASFTCNLKSTNSSNSPPLDYGWAEAMNIQSGLRFQPESAVHLFRAEDRLFLRNDRKKADFEYGTTRVVRSTEVERLIQEFFGRLRESDGPVILLVHNEKLARRVLQELGVDTTEWKSGIGELLRPQRSRRSTQNTAPRNDYEERKHRPRDRSQSPSLDSTRPPRRSPSTQTHTKLDAVYVVDIQSLYLAMMQSEEKHIADVAQKLGVLGDGGVWCAGNEAVYIFQVWLSLISGLAIDERRALLLTAKGREPSTGPQATEQRVSQAPPDESDEDFDPNDIVQESSEVQHTQGGDDESDTDYGSDY